MKITIENVTENQAISVLSLLDPKHKGKLVEEKFKADNSASASCIHSKVELTDGAYLKCRDCGDEVKY